MAYDEALAARVREVLAGEADIEERRMTGGLAFLLGGTMLGGVIRDCLYVRVGPEAMAGTLAEAHVGPFRIGGRATKGFVEVEPGGIRSDEDLRRWVARGLAFVRGT